MAGRPREFDELEVLDRAMTLFWLRGYEAVGLRELLEHMGISRQSLYDTFGSKRQLFIRSIEHYRTTQLSSALALLEGDGSAIERVREVVRFFEALAMDTTCRGCLVANALVELGPHDEEIAGMLGDILEALRGAIERALVEAQERGELSPAKSPVQLSRAITNALLGMAVSGKLQLENEALRDVYAGTLSMLD